MTFQDQSTADQIRKRVLVVDDHPIARKVLVNIINQEADLAVCAEAEGEAAALGALETLQPDIAVVDWSAKDRDACALITTLRQSHPQTPLLVLAMHDELFFAERVLRAGVQVYIMNQEAPEKITAAIHRVIAGRSHPSSRIDRVTNSTANG